MGDTNRFPIEFKIPSTVSQTEDQMVKYMNILGDIFHLNQHISGHLYPIPAASHFCLVFLLVSSTGMDCFSSIKVGWLFNCVCVCVGGVGA